MYKRQECKLWIRHFTQKLLLFLLGIFNKITIDKLSNRYGKVILYSQLSLREGVAYVQKKSETAILLEEAASIIRNDVLQMKKMASTLPFPLTAKDIAFGEGKIPHLLQSFYRVL